MDPRLGTALAVVVGVPAVIVGYIYATEFALSRASERLRNRLRPWLWLLPALLFLFLFLVWPTILTIIRSFQGKAGPLRSASPTTRGSSRAAIRCGPAQQPALAGHPDPAHGRPRALIALLVDRVRYESVAKSMIFVPLAISMVAAR